MPAWVALARLYAEHGAAGKAAAALQAARSHEPAVPAIWEAMADVAALSPTGAHGWGRGLPVCLPGALSLAAAGNRRLQSCNHPSPCHHLALPP